MYRQFEEDPDGRENEGGTTSYGTGKRDREGGRAGRMTTRSRAGRSTPRRPRVAVGHVPALTGGGGSRLACVLACHLPARYRLNAR